MHGGPPSVAPSSTLSPKAEGDGPRSVAPFQVVFFGPKGEVDAREEGMVTVLFNRAMRDLDAPDDANLPAVTIKTKDGRTPAGKWRYVGTRGVVFEADKSLPGASEFDVVVPAGTKAMDGSSLAAELRFSFSTTRPHVITEHLLDRKNVRPDAAFRLEFDQKVDPAAVAKVAKLVTRSKPSDPPRIVALTARRANGVASIHAERFVELVPTEKLPLDSALDLTIGSGLASMEGPLTSEKSETFPMRTYGPLRLVDVRCAKQNLGRCLQHHRVEAVLSNEVMPKDFLAHLKVEGGEPAKLLVASAPKGPRNAHGVVADTIAGKHYKVKITKGLRDVFGQVLDKDIEFAVDVEAPFVGGPGKKDDKSGATPEPPDDEPKIADAPKPPANVPHRPILKYEAQIGITGRVVEAVANSGLKSHKVPIGLVNVPTVGIQSAKLGEPELLSWLQGKHAEGPTGGGWKYEWWTPNVPENVRAVRMIDLDNLLGGRGVAVMALDVPGQGYGGVPTQTSLVNVTDLAITARMSKYGGLVWITRLSDGKAVANAQVKVLRLKPKKNQTVEAYTTTTDANGLATIPADKYAPTVTNYGPSDSSILVAKLGDDWAFQPVERSYSSTASWGDVDLTQKGSYRALVFTDRGVYRPGETVKLAGVLRKGDAAGLVPPAGKDVRLRVTDGEGNEILATRAKADAFGAFAVDVPITKTARYGSATITAAIGEEQYVASAGFLLAAYKASAFKVAVDPDKKAYVHGDAASFAIAGEYLYGAAMNGASVRTTVTRAPIDFRPPKTDGYVLVEEDTPHGWVAGLVGQPEGDLDDKGKWTAHVPLELKGQYGPERVTVEAEIEDATHQTVAKSTSAIVHPAEFYVGLSRGGSKFSTLKGGALEIKPAVAAFEPSGARRAGVSVVVELVERTYKTATAEQGDGSAVTTSKPEDVVVGTCTVTTTAADAGCTLTAKEVGYYRLRARAKDPRGNEVRSSTTLYVVSESPDGPSPWPKTDLRVLKLEPEKTTFKVGEKARILVTSPFKKATALVTVERAGVLDKQVIPIEGATPVIEIPVKKEWFPNVFVSIDVVRGRIQAPPAAEKGKLDLGGPEFRFGTTELKIDPESHRLKVAITPSKTQLQPGETFDADVALTDADGKPAKGSVTFYAVDEGVLMLTGYKTPDPLPPFSERMRLAVFGMDSREHLARILPMKAGEKVPILGWDWPQPDGWNKGGEYGDGGGSSSTPRADFRATAFFEAGRVTSDDGHAKFKVKLPDNLTSYRLMAVAASGDDRFGFGDANIQASKKLMVRPALPRNVRVGDAFEAAFVIAAKDLPATGVDVTLKTKNLVVEGASTAHVNVAAGQQIPVRFKVKATGPGAASIEVEARGGGASDKVILSRTIELPLATQTVAAYGETNKDMAVKLGSREGMRADSGGLKVSMASSALVGLDTTFERLLDYPYGCTEQLASRTLPLVSLRDLAKQTGTRLPANVDAAIDGAIAKLLENQGYDGGFGFWKDEASIPWLSGYATLVLEETAKKGYQVPNESRERAVQFLRSHMGALIPKDVPDDDTANGGGGADSAAEDDVNGPIGDGLTTVDRKGLQLANAAFMADALATAGSGDPGTLNRLYDRRKEMPLFAQAFLLHAMASAKMPQSQLDSFAKEIESRLIVNPNSVTAQPEGPVYAPLLDSGTRTTALVLRAFLAANPKHPLGARLARGLLDARVSGAWRSTQEDLWALLALDAYRRAQESTTTHFEATAWLGSDSIGHAFFDSYRAEPIFVPAAKVPKEGDLTFQVAGEGKLFWSAELRYATTTLPTKPLDRGFFVEKRTRAFAPADLQEVLKSPAKGKSTSAKIGQLVLVDVYLESSEARDQVVIDDPLPAGLESIDASFETTAKSNGIADEPFVAHGVKKKHNAWITPTFHREHRDDRVLTFLGHVEPGLYHFRYLARATAAGSYVVPPTSVEAMYAPEFTGRTAASTFSVTRD